MTSIHSLGELLVQIRLLGEEQWQKLRHELTDDALPSLLARLEELRAWWSHDGSSSALTAYQRRWIERLSARGQLARLPKALRWSDYLILHELGQGGMGIVFKAWDLAEGRFVAIKRIKGGSLDSYRRFRREARLQRRLSHPRIAHFLKLTRYRGATLLVMEYIDGRTIAEEVKARGPVPWREAVRWTMDILHALQYVHRLKIIHRDLKPSNIILERHSAGADAKLLDLGLAKCLDPLATNDNTTMDVQTVGDALLGTFEYMAPEQWRGAEEIVAASDIYSLGCTLFFALTGGRPPFVANSLVAYCNAHTTAPVPRLSDLRPELPESLDKILQQMLSKEPAKRGSPAQLRKQLGNFLRMESSAPPPQRPALDAATPRPFRPRQAPPPPPHDTPAPARPLSFPSPPSASADDRFTPFPSSPEINVSGLRTAWRVFLASWSRSRRMLFLLFAFLALIAACVLLLRF